jgi:hypothetical protein
MCSFKTANSCGRASKHEHHADDDGTRLWASSVTVESVCCARIRTRPSRARGPARGDISITSGVGVLFLLSWRFGSLEIFRKICMFSRCALPRDGSTYYIQKYRNNFSTDSSFQTRGNQIYIKKKTKPWNNTLRPLSDRENWWQLWYIFLYRLHVCILL